MLDAIRPLEMRLGHYTVAALPDRNHGMQGVRIIRASVGWMECCLNKHTCVVADMLGTASYSQTLQCYSTVLIGFFKNSRLLSAANFEFSTRGFEHARSV